MLKEDYGGIPAYVESQRAKDKSLGESQHWYLPLAK